MVKENFGCGKIKSQTDWSYPFGVPKRLQLTVNCSKRKRIIKQMRLQLIYINKTIICLVM